MNKIHIKKNMILLFFLDKNLINRNIHLLIFTEKKEINIVFKVQTSVNNRN